MRRKLIIMSLLWALTGCVTASGGGCGYDFNLAEEQYNEAE